VDRRNGYINSPVMRTSISRPDEITVAACRWLSMGGSRGDYTGPDPGGSHDLAPLLSKETGRRSLYLSAAASWFRNEQLILPALKRLAASGARLWAVKGLDVAGTLYPFPGGRPMCDVDFLAEREHLDNAIRAFIESGWTPLSPGRGILRSGIVSELKLSRAGARAEIHTHPFYFPATFPGRLPRDLFAGGRDLMPGLSGLAWHNALLYCTLHMLTNVCLRPAWWVDVYLLTGKVSDTGSWMEFARNAACTGLGRPIGNLLSIAVRELGANVPPAVPVVLNLDDRGREHVLKGLRGGSGRPSKTNLIHLGGWKRVSWLVSMLWLALTGQGVLRSG
jgi:hypothetical protein